jgi:hypothetical protein
MKPLREGQLVTVADGDARLDGIVFHVESFLKAEVVVPDGEGGGSFRTAHRKELGERTTEGEHDETLRKLIKRASSGSRGGRGVGGSRGHTRGADHRSTG